MNVCCKLECHDAACGVITLAGRGRGTRRAGGSRGLQESGPSGAEQFLAGCHAHRGHHLSLLAPAKRALRCNFLLQAAATFVWIDDSSCMVLHLLLMMTGMQITADCELIDCVDCSPAHKLASTNSSYSTSVGKRLSDEYVRIAFYM